MTSLNEFARMLNEVDGGKLDGKCAKRRLAAIGATTDDLSSPQKVAYLVKMCSNNPTTWQLFDHTMKRFMESSKELKDLKAAFEELKKAFSEQEEHIDRLTNDVDQLRHENVNLRKMIEELQKCQHEIDDAHKNLPSYVEED